jgi:hypothetical protein
MTMEHSRSRPDQGLRRQTSAKAATGVDGGNIPRASRARRRSLDPQQFMRQRRQNGMSTQHTYRVIVRGTWEGLTDEARARLLAEVEQHGLEAMQFTEEGSLTYDTVLKHFSFRYVVVSDAEDGAEMASAIAEDRAETTLKEHGYGYGRLRSTATDMDTMKINYKGR